VFSVEVELNFEIFARVRGLRKPIHVIYSDGDTVACK
jgi:hypothetical protein